MQKGNLDHNKSMTITWSNKNENAKSIKCCVRPVKRHTQNNNKPTSIMAQLARLILFFVVTMALVFSCCCQANNAYYQDESNPNEPCKGGPMDLPKECGTQCPLTCENQKPRACIRSCKINACECAPGYYRRADGMCSTARGCKIFRAMNQLR